MRRLIASATLSVLLLPAVAFAAPPDRDPAGSPEEEYAILLLLPDSGPEGAVNERDPAPRADDGAAGESVSDDGRGPR